jgi:cell division protein FtsN
LAKSDEGEFELILGNRQLISVFLIVVVLLGVFFSMGYIVGRNSAAPAAEAAHTGGKSVAAESPTAEPQPASANPPATEKEPPANPLDTVSPPAGPPTTHPEQPATSKPAPAKPATSKPTPAPVTPVPVTTPKPKPAAVGPPAVGLATVTREPTAGQYWQVVATSRPDAEIISEALAKKGFHTVVTPASREGIFRVLVGPFQDGAAQAQARTNLEAAGFKHPIIQRY